MHEYFLIEKGKIKDFLRAVMRDFCLVSPQQASQGDFLFQETKDLDKINLDYYTTSNTLKEFFFPQAETIFSYQKNISGRIKITSPQEKLRQTLFFGIRSCDVRAVNLQDRFFTQEPKDNLYWRRRDKSILISFACNRPSKDSCFCISTGGPCLEKTEGFDLQFIDFASEYLVEVGKDKAKDLIKKYKRFFNLADKNIQTKKASFKESCLKKFNQRYDFLKIYDKLKNKDLHRLWEDLARRCTNCGGCEFICPTCFCFYTHDIRYLPHKGERILAWDSCTFSGYSRMAGEINPQEKNSDRIARRFFCKLYNCYNWFGVFACTGCGRCSFVCPVNLDMESFIASLMRTNQYQPLLKEL